MSFERFYAMPRWRAALFFLLPLTGIVFLGAVVRYVVRSWRLNLVGVASVLVVVGSLALGWLLELYPVVLLAKYWFIPLATWAVFINQIRSLAEHYPVGTFQRSGEFPSVFRTRETLCSWFDGWFVVTRGVNFHLSHHLCPQVPFYNLPRLQAELAKSAVYQRYAHVTHGYHRFLLEFFLRRSHPVGAATRLSTAVDRNS